MPQLVMLSGKGGTGKTSLSASLAHLAALENFGSELILIDADVDASNLELLLDASLVKSSPFQGAPAAVIDKNICSDCGRCSEVCRFQAVMNKGGEYRIDPLACEGCAACLYECPQQAIFLQERQAGEWYRSDTPYGRLYHAHLYPAQENSGKLVTHLKRLAGSDQAAEGGGWTLVDGPPGIGCPVISAISGADAALVVTEPSLAAVHDLQRVLDMAAHFQVPVYLAINKADLHPEGRNSIYRLAGERSIPVLGEIPFDLDAARAISAGKPLTVYAPGGPAAVGIKQIWSAFNRYAAGEIPSIAGMNVNP